VLKVGVNARTDAQHLATWWGIADCDYVNHYLAGIINLEEVADELDGKSLSEMTELVLQRKLPKLKVEQSTQQRRRKRQGRSVPT